MRDADRGAGRLLADRRGRLRVGGEEVVERARRGARVRETGRDLAVEEAAEDEDERLVQRDLEPHVRRKRAGDARANRAKASTEAGDVQGVSSWNHTGCV